MERELTEGLVLRDASDGDMGYVLNCIRESVLSSVDEDRRRLSDLWIDGIMSVTEKEISERRMDDTVYVLWNGRDRAGMLWLGSSVDQFTCDPTGYLLGIYVEPEMRRRGVGTSLLRAAEDICRDRGYVTLTLNVGAPNTAALAFYESAGYATQTYVKQRTLL